MADDESKDRAIRVWFRFLRLESRIQSTVAEQLRAIDLSVPQCDVLTTLTEAEGISQQELAQRLYVTKGNISGLLDRLERAVWSSAARPPPTVASIRSISPPRAARPRNGRSHCSMR